MSALPQRLRQIVDAGVDGAELRRVRLRHVDPELLVQSDQKIEEIHGVDVDLLALSQPTFGFTFEVTSHANYKVYDAGGKSALLATISGAYTADFAEAPLGSMRLKRANEGAIRARTGVTGQRCAGCQDVASILVASDESVMRQEQRKNAPTREDAATGWSSS